MKAAHSNSFNTRPRDSKPLKLKMMRAEITIMKRGQLLAEA